jgi:hypothetical protein
MKDTPTVIFPELGKIVLESKPCLSPKIGEMLVQTHRTLIITGTELTMLIGKCPPRFLLESYVRYPVDTVANLQSIARGWSNSEDQ